MTSYNLAYNLDAAEFVPRAYQPPATPAATAPTAPPTASAPPPAIKYTGVVTLGGGSTPAPKKPAAPAQQQQQQPGGGGGGGKGGKAKGGNANANQQQQQPSNKSNKTGGAQQPAAKGKPAAQPQQQPGGGGKAKGGPAAQGSASTAPKAAVVTIGGPSPAKTPSPTPSATSTATAAASKTTTTTTTTTPPAKASSPPPKASTPPPDPTAVQKPSTKGGKKPAADAATAKPTPAATSAAATSSSTAAKPKAASPSPDNLGDEEDYGDIPPEEMDDELRAELRNIAVEEMQLVEESRENMNVIFIGHVDSGKSTISGQVLLQTGMVEKRLIDKYEGEAREKNRESWWLAYIMDMIEEERQKGKTIEVGRANFETSVRRYTILDAPGHRSYVPNMIAGAAQADIGILVLSARKDEFETGFDRGGQTREHTQLAKTVGIKQLICAVNKMDDPTVNWSIERYNEIVDKMTPFLLKQCQYAKKDIIFVPISGYAGINIKDPVKPSVCPWYSGPCLLQILDSLTVQRGRDDLPLRMPIIDKYKDIRGNSVIMGKIESGTILLEGTAMIMPTRVTVEVFGIIADEQGTMLKKARPGDNVRLMIKGEVPENVFSGFVLCSTSDIIQPVSTFEAQIVVMDLQPNKSVFCPGYQAVFHCHTAVEECQITRLLAQIDKQTGVLQKKNPTFVRVGSVVVARVVLAKPVCLEKFDSYQQLGRFTLRDGGKTIAFGKITFLGKRPPKNPAKATTTPAAATSTTATTPSETTTITTSVTPATPAETTTVTPATPDQE
ncbi:translation elongation factor EF1A [Pelomyxa schiedti]|nr:translation elongation factor EF1A [Pelomyxa schiedti]